MDKTFIFDLDDTLIWNQHYYSLAQLHFASFVMSAIGPRTPNLQEIINLEVSIDVTLTKTFGFSKDRFPSSFQLAYREIRTRLGLPEDKLGEMIAYRFGEGAFNEEKWKKEGLVQGAKETLDFLVQNGDELLLLTKGDYDIQKRKLEVTECNRWFGNIRDGRMNIVPEKSSELFEKIVGDRDKSKIWAVGNSAKSDIIPALKVGLKAVYIPQETWAYEKHSDVEFASNPRLVTFNEIIEIKERYSELT
jgi:putative hydrolase of the HAD superfamily